LKDSRPDCDSRRIDAWQSDGFLKLSAKRPAAADRATELAPDAGFVLLCQGVIEYFYGWNGTTTIPAQGLGDTVAAS